MLIFEASRFMWYQGGRNVSSASSPSLKGRIRLKYGRLEVDQRRIRAYARWGDCGDNEAVFVFVIEMSFVSKLS